MFQSRSHSLVVALLLVWVAACGQDETSGDGSGQAGAADASLDAALDAVGADAGGPPDVVADVTPADIAPDDGADLDAAASDTALADVAPQDAGQVGADSTDSAGGDLGPIDASQDAGADTGQGGGQGGTWTLPGCATPTDAPGVGFAPKGGLYLHLSTAPMKPGKTYTMGLAAADTPGVLVAEHAGTLYRSVDSGCSWKIIGAASTSPVRIVPSKGGRFYAFYDNGSELLRIDGELVTPLVSPVQNILGLGADRSNPDAVRVGGKDGQIWRSFDGGKLWKKSGVAPAAPSASGYRVAFSPLFPDRALYGGMTQGFFLTQDGGASWKSSTFVGAAIPAKLNGMNAVFSGLDDKIAWAMAIDLSEGMQFPSKTNGKHIWRSTDGGASFEKVVDHLANDDLIITNGTHLVPDTANPAVVRWTFGTCISGYGTNLYRYDHGAAGDKLTWVNHPVPGIVEWLQHPADASLLVVGIRADDSPLCF